jgi:hypothetical protein
MLTPHAYAIIRKIENTLTDKQPAPTTVRLYESLSRHSLTFFLGRPRLEGPTVCRVDSPQRLRPCDIPPKQINRRPSEQRRTECSALTHLEPNDLKAPPRPHSSCPRRPTLRWARSERESNFMLSITAQVWNTFTSRVARATCAGVV